MSSTIHNSQTGRWHRDKLLDYSFLAGIALKVINIIGDFAIGIPLLFIQPEQISHLTKSITANELIEDPGDHIANLLLSSTAHLQADTLLYLAIYLLIHAIVKLAIIAGLVRGTHKAYPWAIGALGIMLAYQIVNILIKFSVTMTVLSSMDIVILWLTWREWKHDRTLQDVLMLYAPKMAQRWPFRSSV